LNLRLIDDHGRQTIRVRHEILDNIASSEQQKIEVSLLVTRLLENVDLQRQYRHMVPSGSQRVVAEHPNPFIELDRMDLALEELVEEECPHLPTAAVQLVLQRLVRREQVLDMLVDDLQLVLLVGQRRGQPVRNALDDHKDRRIHLAAAEPDQQDAEHHDRQTCI
jgi:hypothetical protein